MPTTIWQRLENKIDNIGKKAKREAEKKVRHEKITEMAGKMDIWEKIKLIIKLI